MTFHDNHGNGTAARPINGAASGHFVAHGRAAEEIEAAPPCCAKVEGKMSEIMRDPENHASESAAKLRKFVVDAIQLQPGIRDAITVILDARDRYKTMIAAQAKRIDEIQAAASRAEAAMRIGVALETALWLVNEIDIAAAAKLFNVDESTIRDCDRFATLDIGKTTICHGDA